MRTPAVLLVAFALAPTVVFAFHDGGVASCAGCHTMHGSQDGVPPGTGSSDFLLRYDHVTDVCLACHASAYGAVLGHDPRNPPPELGGGNFTYLLEDNLNDAPGGATNPIGGHHAGHSIVSPAWGLLPDPDRTVAPGGTYPSDQLACTSCHDPHGNTSFRMLWGSGSVVHGGLTFLYDAPLAEAMSGAAVEESPTNHTAYRAGWADWCANCHTVGVHEGGGIFAHPSDAPLGDAGARYNEYDGPGNPTGGSWVLAYIPETPFEDPAATAASASGATPSSRLMCMTCHRAHATSAPAALRWDPNVLRLSEDGFASLSYPIPSPYGDPEQRALCIKCHYPDAVDHGMDQPCLSCHL